MFNEDLKEYETNNGITGYPSIDKPWLKYYSERDFCISNPNCTVYQNIYNRNEKYTKDIAINYYGNRISYGELFKRVDQCAKALRSIGIQSGDCVTMCTAGVPEAIYTVLACSRIGAIANFINPMFTTKQMIDRINDTESEWILVLDALFSYVEKALFKTCVKNVVVIPATNSVPFLFSKILYTKSAARKILNDRNTERLTYYSWTNFIKMGTNFCGAIDVPYKKDTPTVMVYSSGSTGASKGILLTNDGINSTIMNYQTDGFPYNRNSTFLQMIPIWFSTGIVLSILMPLTMGIEVIPEPKFSKETFAKDLIKYKPTMTLAATSLWIYVINSKETQNLDLSRMDYPITGGEKILPLDEWRMHDFLEKHGCKSRMIKGYGMCELGGTVSTSSRNPETNVKTGSTGYPILNVTVAAFSVDTDDELKYGERGEIRVCSPARMKGYYKNVEATEAFFKIDKKGNIWGCTGAIGYVDEDGEVFVLGRASDCCIRENGEKVFLFDIESEIFEEPLVNQCKVVDIQENGRTKLVAHIVFKEGASDPERIINRIDDYLRDKLPDYMVPEYYKIRLSMPVHSNGKRDVETLKNDKENLLSMEPCKYEAV